MCTSIYHFEGIPTHFSIREGVEGCYDVLSLLSDRSSRKCFNLFGLDPKSMKPSFLSVMESIEQEVNHIGRLIDSFRFTPDCLAERTKNLLTLQQLCEELVIEVLNSILRNLEQPSFYLNGKPVMFDDITTLFQESNAAQRFFLFGAELNCKASDILGVLSAIEEARVSSGTNRNLDILDDIYTQAKNQLTGSSMVGNGGNKPTKVLGITIPENLEKFVQVIVGAAPSILKGMADFMF
jgi:hypothetical protein